MSGIIGFICGVLVGEGMTILMMGLLKAASENTKEHDDDNQMN